MPRCAPTTKLLTTNYTNYTNKTMRRVRLGDPHLLNFCNLTKPIFRNHHYCLQIFYEKIFNIVAADSFVPCCDGTGEGVVGTAC